jgi:hypothetical protein
VQFSDLEPTVDAFASNGNQRVSKFWTIQDDAFKQNWSNEILWANPSFSQLDRVLQKILIEDPQGILIVPCWTRFLWFTVLESIAVKWRDIPADAESYQSIHCRKLNIPQLR